MLNGVLVTELSLDMVKEYLRIDHDDDDLMLSTMLYASKSFIQTYLNQKFSEFDEIPGEFTIAALALTAHWYERREIQGDKETTKELSYVFKGLLDPHRSWNAGGEYIEEDLTRKFK